MKVVVVLALLVLSLIPVLNAQTANDDALRDYTSAVKAYDDAVVQLQRSHLRDQKREIIRQTMPLTDDEARAFWPIYDQYEEAVRKNNDKRLAIVADYLKYKSDMPAGKAAELINRVMEAQNEKHELKRSYVKELGTVLTGRQALRLLLMENKMDLQIDAEIAAQIPLQ